MTEGRTLLVSFSGGRSSALMARLVQTSPIWERWNKVYAYANTGREREETLRFIHECDKRWGLGVAWLEAEIKPQKGDGTTHRIVSYETAVRNTDPAGDAHPFIAMAKKYGVPNNAFPHCTRELKSRPIASYMRALGISEYKTAIGIRVDEAHRAKSNPDVVYPLIDLNIDEETVRTFWDRQGFDLGLKDYQGNCDLCFKKSLRKRLTMLRETPEIASFWASLEGEHLNPKGLLVDVVFDRNRFSVPELLVMSKDPNLELAVDRHEARLANVQPELFERAVRVDWDFEKPCHCQST